MAVRERHDRRDDPVHQGWPSVGEGRKSLPTTEVHACDSTTFPPSSSPSRNDFLPVSGSPRRASACLAPNRATLPSLTDCPITPLRAYPLYAAALMVVVVCYLAPLMFTKAIPAFGLESVCPTSSPSFLPFCNDFLPVSGSPRRASACLAPNRATLPSLTDCPITPLRAYPLYAAALMVVVVCYLAPLMFTKTVPASGLESVCPTFPVESHMFLLRVTIFFSFRVHFYCLCSICNSFFCGVWCGVWGVGCACATRSGYILELLPGCVPHHLHQFTVFDRLPNNPP